MQQSWQITVSVDESVWDDEQLGQKYILMIHRQKSCFHPSIKECQFAK